MLMSAKQPLVELEEPAFVPRHIRSSRRRRGPDAGGDRVASRSALIDAVVPRADLPREADGAAGAIGEAEALAD